MKRAVLALLLVPLIVLWAYGCDEAQNPLDTQASEAVSADAGPSFAKGGKPKPLELPTDCADGAYLKWDATESAWVCEGRPDISHWSNSGTVPAGGHTPDIIGCYDRAVGGGFWAEPGLIVNVMAPEYERSEGQDVEGRLNENNMYFEIDNPTSTPLDYTVYVICMDDPRP